MSSKKLIKQQKKKEQEELQSRALPVFRAKCKYGENYVNIDVIGSVLENTQLPDQVMDIETSKEMENLYGKNIYHIMDCDGYTVVGKMFYSNISVSQLLNNINLPIFYMTIMYEKKFITGFLPNIYLYFVIDESTLKEISGNPKNYLNRQLTGHFKLQVIPDDDYMENFVEYIRPITEEKIMEQNLGELDPDISVENLPEEFYINIQKLTNKKLAEYENLLNVHEFSAYTKKEKIIKDYIKPLCSNELFRDILKAGIRIREIERQKNSVESYVFKQPKRVFNLRELKDNPDKVDELLNADSDAESDVTSYSDE